MIKKIKITDEHLKLIRCIKFERFVFKKDSRNEHIGWGIDQYTLFGGNYCLEDVSIILGCYDKHIPGTETDPLGVDFPEDLKAHMWELYQDLWDNMEYIIDLVLFYSDRGGLKVGTYSCIANEREWEYTPDN